MDSLRDFILVINEEGVIISTFPTDSILSDEINQELARYISSKDLDIYQNFINQTHQKEIIMHQKIHLCYQEKKYLLKMSGFKEGQNTYIFCIFNSSSDEDVLIKMMRLNSEQVNELRVLNKNLSTLDSKAFEEISKLNSELLNSKRIIEKQNSELQRYNQLLKKMSIEDGLTGCYNRRYFHEYMSNHFLASQKDNIHSMIMIDFNHFKQVNDEFGHDAGDRLLILFVEIVKDVIKKHGDIFRIGGDEFIIVLKNMDEKHANSVICDIEKQFNSKSKIVSLAYGIVSFNESELNNEFDLTSIIKKSDLLMYHDKKDKKSMKIEP